jgi:hypothetical protein
MDKKATTNSNFDIYLGKNKLKYIKQIYGTSSKASPNVTRSNFNSVSQLNSTVKNSNSNINDLTGYSLPKILEKYNRDFSHLTPKKYNMNNLTHFTNTGNNSYSVTNTDGGIDKK